MTAKGPPPFWPRLTFGRLPLILVLGLLIFLGGTWIATPLLASSSSGRLLVTTAHCMWRLLTILLTLFFLLAIIVVGALLFACHLVKRRGILALLREISGVRYSEASAVLYFFLKGPSSLPVSYPPNSKRGDAPHEDLNLRKFFARPDIIHPPPPKRSTKLVFRTMDNGADSAMHLLLQKIRQLEVESRAAAAENEKAATAKTKRGEHHLRSWVDACPCCIHRQQPFKQSDLFEEAAQRQFRRIHRTALARPLVAPSLSGSCSFANTSGAEGVQDIKPIRPGKRRILRPAPN
ncbi:hypothetical protein GSI_01170 [Ganoderma sinense ZZ0214-1]|uniref:Uncharacterized protein n=1 Tax=Ganoderma sinense ZZ0214-1 TaxID=1077348 RepID=A0A2G8SUM3_9APHY|nr:hypothetical protein GSI_01170 [Ganoderma sinense ZZ0214-1]